MWFISYHLLPLSLILLVFFFSLFSSSSIPLLLCCSLVILRQGLTLQSRMASKLQFPCVNLSNSGIIVMWQHTHFKPKDLLFHFLIERSMSQQKLPEEQFGNLCPQSSRDVHIMQVFLYQHNIPGDNGLCPL